MELLRRSMTYTLLSFHVRTKMLLSNSNLLHANQIHLSFCHLRARIEHPLLIWVIETVPLWLVASVRSFHEIALNYTPINRRTRMISLKCISFSSSLPGQLFRQGETSSHLAFRHRDRQLLMFWGVRSPHLEHSRN